MNTLIDIFNSFQKRGNTPVFVYRTGVRRFVFSYEQLHDLSLKMSGWLSAQGIEKRDRVVLWAPNSPWWAVAYWGIIAHGAVVVPVDFMSDKKRAEDIARLSGAKLIVQSKYKLDGCFSTDELPVRIIENLEFDLTTVHKKDNATSVSSEDVAQLVYTSGTTGNPKGVMLTHKNLCANLAQALSHIEIQKGWRFLSVLPLSHMFEQMGGFLVPLITGGTIVYVRTLKPSSIMESLHHENINIMMIVPRLLQALSASIERELERKHLGGVFNRLINKSKQWAPAKRKRIFAPIRKKFGKDFEFFVSGGAALDEKTALFWKHIGFTIIEGYGLTECSPLLALNTLEKQIIGSVGQPVPHVSITLREKEIIAKGDNVFSGYWENPEATNNAFTDDGWFKTGDLGEIDDQGNLYIKGRQKEMIVTGAGVNVFPDDIEPVLNSVPGVKESCIIGLDSGHGEEVHAVVMLESDSTPVEEIIQEANKKLDPIQRITGVSVWPEPEFPKTTTLKIKKFLVKKHILESGNNNHGNTTDQLINLVSRATNKPASEINEDSQLVMDLGLTSIARLELVNFIEQEYRLDIDDSRITQTTTVQDLRSMIAAREKVSANDKGRIWTNSFPIRLLRRFWDYIFQYPLLALFAPLHTRFDERISKYPLPVIFAANHVSYLDQLPVMKSLPPHIRYRTATISREEIYFPRTKNVLARIWGIFLYEYVSWFNNVFLLPKESGFRKSLEYMGQLIDTNVNIYMYPEGVRTDDDKMVEFQKGIGIMVKELQVPVVPIHIHGFEKVFPKGAFLPRRGPITISFGQPIVFTTESPQEIIETVKNAIHDLKPHDASRTQQPVVTP